MATVRDVFERLIPDQEELEQFAAWAFGPYYRELDQAINFMETWNYLHGVLLMLQPDGLLQEDAEKMVQVWRDNK